MELHETEPTQEGKSLIVRWQAAHEEVVRARTRLNAAEVDLANSTNALGKWLVPEDAAFEEKFCVWYGATLLEAQMVTTHVYAVKSRKRRDQK